MAKKKRRKKRKDTLVLRLILIVAVVLVVFEGRLVYTMVTYRASTRETVSSDSPGKEPTTGNGVIEKKTDTSAKLPGAEANTSGSDSVLAGLPFSGGSAPVHTSAVAERLPTVSDPDSPAIVAACDTPVDDSYFSDAVFIGDSRMQGFQNSSGITQGTFFTSVGMSLSKMKSEPIIQTPDGNLTVAAAISGRPYQKIYLMLGTNDLGEYSWDVFREGFISCIENFRRIQPNAIIYICSVIYVEESKVTTGSYVNNTNVDTINSILLDICEEKGYHYLDLNEILSNGYGSLIEGASSDGVHVYGEYHQKILAYLKNHYVTEDNEDSGTEAQSEASTEADSENTQKENTSA